MNVITLTGRVAT